MATKPFHFKRFSIADDHCTHKVGTDGVLLGSWVHILETDKYMLDIGTGSGLIALMLAQRSPKGCHIDAIDIEKEDVQQAINNVAQSPWPEKITLWNTSVQEFLSPHEYDLIVSNPPFFINSLLPPGKARSRARHTQTLSFEDLLFNVKRLLAPNGRFGVVLPYQEGLELVERAAALHLFPGRIVSFRSRKHKPVERLLTEFSIGARQAETTDLVLYEDGEQWSEDYKSMTKDFYLKS